MATNPYFNHYNSSAEQTLIEDLVVEAIKYYGIDVQYIPRTVVEEDTLMGDDPLSEFNDYKTIEMYIRNVDGFDGENEFVSKFGLEIRDQITFTVSRRSWRGLGFVDGLREESPREGDLIWFPVTKTLFEVLHVKDEVVFYQTGTLQTFDLVCETFRYSHQDMNTGIDEVDAVQYDYGYSVNLVLSSGSGDFSIGESLYQGDSLANATARAVVSSWSANTNIVRVVEPLGSFTSNVAVLGVSSGTSRTLVSYDDYELPTDSQAQNREIEDEGMEFLDFTESNPFGEV